MRVLFLPEVREYFDFLADILFEEEYFAFEENARQYAKDVFDDIEENLPNRRKKPAPKHFEKYGKDMYYSGFRKNRNTIWYAFFTKYEENGETVYMVRHIENNHTAAHFL
jgi:hypothetical protein